MQQTTILYYRFGLLISLIFCASCSSQQVYENPNDLPQHTTNENTATCPLYVSPIPGWCSDGKIVEHAPNEHGCVAPPTCVRDEVITEKPVLLSRLEGDMCAGIAGLLCQEGLICQLEGSYPDASGICVKQELNPSITKTELDQGWYAGIQDKKKPGTPDDWVWDDTEGGKWRKPTIKEEILCPQVITFAKDPKTKECKWFPTPCHAPKDWEPCKPN